MLAPIEIRESGKMKVTRFLQKRNAEFSIYSIFDCDRSNDVHKPPIQALLEIVLYMVFVMIMLPAYDVSNSYIILPDALTI